MPLALVAIALSAISGVFGEPQYYFFEPDKSVGGKVVFETDPVYDAGKVTSFVFESESFEKGTFVSATGEKSRMRRKTQPAKE